MKDTIGKFRIPFGGLKVGTVLTFTSFIAKPTESENSVTSIKEIDNRMFPIIGDTHITQIPWRFLNEEMAMINHDQNLETLARRGGLNLIEAWGNIKKIKWGLLTIRDFDKAKSFITECIKNDSIV